MLAIGPADAGLAPPCDAVARGVDRRVAEG